MAGEEQGGTLGSQVLEQGQQGDRQDWVQGREGLVQNQQPRLQHEGPPEAEPLGQPAGPGRRALRQCRLREPYLGGHPRCGLDLLRGGAAPPDGQGLLQDLPAGAVGRQAARGILEDRLQQGPAGAALALRQGRPGLARQADAALRGLPQAQHQLQQGGLPGPTGSHQPQGLARGHLEAQIAQEPAPGPLKAQALDGQDGDWCQRITSAPM